MNGFCFFLNCPLAISYMYKIYLDYSSPYPLLSCYGTKTPGKNHLDSRSSKSAKFLLAGQKLYSPGQGLESTALTQRKIELVKHPDGPGGYILLQRHDIFIPTVGMT